MRFGMCIGGDYEKIPLVKQYGYDYIETCFSLFSEAESENYERFAKELKKNDITCESANCFLPGTMKSTGPDADFEKIREYVEYGMAKAEKLGVKTVVFGSGGSRQVPDGFCFGNAVNQLVDLLENVINPIAVKYNITVVIEPLYDCNIISTVKEGAMLASMADCSNIRSLADYYHMGKMHDDIENIKQCEGIIRHSHIAECNDRHFPKPEDTVDYSGFISALEEAGCERCSVEGRTDDFVKDAPVAIGVLKSL